MPEQIDWSSWAERRCSETQRYVRMSQSLSKFFSTQLGSWRGLTNIAGGLELTSRFFYRQRYCTLFGRDFKLFKVGADNKADGIVLELEIDSVGFSESIYVFEIKLQNGVSHEFKCANSDDFLQWKRALADYRGSRSSAVATVSFAGFAKKLLCMFVQEQAEDAFENALGEEGGDGGEGAGTSDLPVEFVTSDVQDDLGGNAGDLGGGLENLMEADE
jgi:hypothetical protein